MAPGNLRWAKRSAWLGVVLLAVAGFPRSSGDRPGDRKEEIIGRRQEELAQVLVREAADLAARLLGRP
jgi:hypothetical protein